MVGLDWDKRISPTDFVIVRFATCKHHFMRAAHRNIDVWLKVKQIEYTSARNAVYFELPDYMTRYTIITKELMERLAPFAREIKRQLSAISWSAKGLRSFDIAS